jgi:uncharacterized membrane protein YphA (DoxX/SURF4 family)
MNISFTLRGATILRLGLSLVFLWFGTQQFLHPEMWIGFIPESIIKISPVGPVTLVHINGALELVFGTALIFGLFTRISALILALHMAHITFLVGYDSIGVRDFGLVISAFAIFFNGADSLTLDNLLFFRKKRLGEAKEMDQSLSEKRKVKYL